MEYEPDQEEPVSAAVVHAVSTFEQRDPTALPPLHDTVDPDALDALFAPTGGGAEQRSCVSFTFSASFVTVDADGRVTVVPDAAPAAEPACQ
ncbi:HalOD1 output domain-containing protein [Haloarcula salina]|uniref:HalOD1 output domain-containing protein n=1 Tax=Haloarcula salina TaxID=1429914 RepID=UPI003C6EABFD